MKQRYVRITRRLTMVGLLFCAAIGLPTAVAQTDSPPSSSSNIRAGHDLFEQSIRPILIEHCYECHSSGAEEVQANLRLDDREAVRRGGDTGPAVVPGSPAESLLLQAMRHEDLQMPPDQKLPEEVIERFERWIEIGAPDPREKPAMILADKKTTAIDWDAARKFWAFQPPKTSPLPRVEHQEWPRRRHDRFVLARMEQHQLAPSEIVALGFLGLGPKYYNRGRLEVKAEEWADRVDTVCRSLLGLTVACARCHDHKYDPIPTADYYAMASVFASTEMLNRPFPGTEEKDGRAKDPDKATQAGYKPSPFRFYRHGESGMQMSELFPHLARCADDLCVLRGMYTDVPNHEPGLLMMNSGHQQPVRPSLTRRTNRDVITTTPVFRCSWRAAG